MKTMVMVGLIIAIFIYTGCKKSETSKIEKTIIDKTQKQDSGFLFPPFISIETSYFVVADDGTICHVGMSEYYRVKIGDLYKCHWYTKR